MVVLSKSKIETSADKRNKRRTTANILFHDSVCDLIRKTGKIEALTDNAFLTQKLRHMLQKETGAWQGTHKATLTFSSTSYFLV